MTERERRWYADSFEHIRDELRRLDLQIMLHTHTAPLLNKIAPGSQIDRTAYISPDEVTWLLARSDTDRPTSEDIAAIRQQLAELSATIDERLAASRDAGIALSLPRAREVFRLSEFETRVLVICLAPELRPKYDRLYAYIQDDITRKRASVDLILRLLCDSEDQRWERQRLFAATAALFRWHLVQTVTDPHSPSGSSGLGRFLRLDPRICRFLLGDDEMDARLTDVARLLCPAGEGYVVDEAAAAIIDHALFAQHHPDRGRIIYLRGPAGAGKSAVALKVCHDRQLAVIAADMEELLAFPADDAAAMIRATGREAALRGCVVYLDRADALLREPLGTVARALGQTAADLREPLLLGGEQPWGASRLLAGTDFQTIDVPMPDIALRARMWRHHINGYAPDDGDWAESLAARFTLGQDRIREAVLRAEQRCVRASLAAPLTLKDLAAACREQSHENLDGLAVKIEPHYGWHDLVLPEPKIEQLKEICGQVRHHHLVYGNWGFKRKFGHGTGLTVLFAGPPGTGKTMAAEVVAAAVGLSVFKVDLSGVVSKYIGETEKNLARIFRETHASNAILFFDEADALFGKRTDVSDAHDRYANIETSYLLQKLDEHEGLVLLASNLRANLDAAFTRRIRYVVDFPFPDTAHRRRIWESHFPAETPLHDDVDFAALADQFALTGGNIQNIVLNAAFLAAADGQRVGTRHIISSTRREFEKLGKLWCEPAGLEVKR